MLFQPVRRVEESVDHIKIHPLDGQPVKDPFQILDRHTPADAVTRLTERRWFIIEMGRRTDDLAVGTVALPHHLRPAPRFLVPRVDPGNMHIAQFLAAHDRFFPDIEQAVAIAPFIDRLVVTFDKTVRGRTPVRVTDTGRNFTQILPQSGKAAHQIDAVSLRHQSGQQRRPWLLIGERRDLVGKEALDRPAELIADMLLIPLMGEPQETLDRLWIQRIHKMIKIFEMLLYGLRDQIDPPLAIRRRPAETFCRVPREIPLFVIPGEAAVLKNLLLVNCPHILRQVQMILQIGDPVPDPECPGQDHTAPRGR